MDIIFLTGNIEIADKGINTFDSILKLRSSVYIKIQELGSRVPKAMRVLDFFYKKPSLMCK